MRNFVLFSVQIFLPSLGRLGVVLSLALGLSTASHGQVATTTQLSVAVPSVAVGVPTLLTATVTDAASHPVLAGTVTFYDGSRSLGSAQIVSGTSGAYPQGTANIKTASFSLGANSISAVFGGAKSDLTSTSAAKTVTVTGKNLTTTALTGYAVGTDFYLTAALEAFGSGTPTGSVDFSHMSNGVPVETIDTKSLTGATWGTSLSISSTALIGGVGGGIPESASRTGYDDVVAVGDFNGDGFLDLAMNSNSGSSYYVNVLLGNGDGTFKPPVTYPDADGRPTSIYTADFNNDGRLDLAVVNYTDGAIGILLGNGDGTFQPAVEYGSEPGAEYAYVGDLNRDGNLDIVLGGEKSQALSIALLLGNGDGTFQTKATYPVGSGFGPTQVVGGDLNGDGVPDLVVTTGDGEDVLLGKGDGTFLPGTLYPLGSIDGNLIALADVNGDGRLDIVWSILTTANSIYGWTGSVGVFLGKGDGTFEKAQTYPIAGYPQQPVVADFNHDGKPDVVVGLEIIDQEYDEGSNIQLLSGNGDGTFQAGITYLPNQTTGYLASGDFNGDGRPDLAAAGGFSEPAFSMEAVILNGQTTSVQVGRSELGPGTTTTEASYTGDGAFAGNVSNAVKLIQNETPPPNYPSTIQYSFTDTTNLLFNGSATAPFGVLWPENGEPNQAGSVYYAAPQNVQAFTTDFVFVTSCCIDSKADGLTFIIQNDGPQALGGAGGGLGYEGINKSVAIKFDLYNNSGEGNNSTGLYTNGTSPTVPAVDLTGSGINLQDSDRFGVHITYDGATLTLSITDISGTFSSATYTHSWAIDIPATVGGTTAYVGFTGATGGIVSQEDIYSWTYVPGAP
jgi:Legume lectin domain/Bacterial Ig-like domain (group 3)/FG-GAP-like repeat